MAAPNSSRHLPNPGAATLQPSVEVAVVGAGAAGLYAALVAAEAGASVRLISSTPLSGSASFWAQGGLAAALGAADSPELHLGDTLNAGRRAARETAARVLCEEAPERVRDLERRGVPFDRDEQGRLALGLEGGHGRRRVVHAGGSATGREVASVLSRAALADDRISVHERTTALSLWIDDGRCRGVMCEGEAMPAAATILATGGTAALWARTTNPRGAVGAGLLLARAAGAALADLELLQFHPTALYAPGPRDGFLITEAVRGEGARLLDANGKRFVDELAPRDEVARAIDAELTRSGCEHVMLDMREVDLAAFPNIVAALAEVGLDPQREPVPVAPAAHYSIGGIAVDTDARSTVPGLFAIGECACTGMHGANRLASNSLSECLVFGRRAALATAESAAQAPHSPPTATPPAPPAPVQPAASTRKALSLRAGIVRSPERLRELEADRHPLARLVGRAALAREESRGCHLRSDLPAPDPELDRGHLVFSAGSDEPQLEHWA
jgi:L-aspartate oxidase